MHKKNEQMMALENSTGVRHDAVTAQLVGMALSQTMVNGEFNGE